MTSLASATLRVFCGALVGLTATGAAAAPDVAHPAGTAAPGTGEHVSETVTAPTPPPAPQVTTSASSDLKLRDPQLVVPDVAPKPFSLEAFRGSTIWYTHSLSVLSFDPAAEPTYDPVWTHRISLRPYWQFSKHFHAAARFDLTQELTNADDTTYEYQVLASDLALEVGGTWSEPRTGIEFAPALRVGLPTSLASQAATMWFSIAPTLNVSRTFPVLQGLTVSLLGRWSKFFNTYTTPTFDGTIIPCGDPRAPSCDQFVQSGTRSASWVIATGPTLSLAITDRWSVDLLVWFFYSQLYPLSPATVTISGQTLNLGAGDGVNQRYTVLAAIDATYRIGRGVSISLGAFTYSGEPGPDGAFRDPFVNRYTTLSLDLIVDVVTAILGDPKTPQVHP
jgi:hypothetical protein